VLIDTPPSLGLLEGNALVAADWVVFPFDGTEEALDGMRAVQDVIAELEAASIPAPKILGALQTKWAEENMSKRVRGLAKEHLGVPVLEATVRNAVRYKDAAANGLDIHSFEELEKVRRSDRRAGDYEAAADELLATLQINPPQKRRAA
jgi:chromosome partitioning protein